LDGVVVGTTFRAGAVTRPGGVEDVGAGDTVGPGAAGFTGVVAGTARGGVVVTAGSVELKGGAVDGLSTGGGGLTRREAPPHAVKASATQMSTGTSNPARTRPAPPKPPDITSPGASNTQIS
jgi:hypothetical protein